MLTVFAFLESHLIFSGFFCHTVFSKILQLFDFMLQVQCIVESVAV